jgi:hypothetical protein
MTKEERIAKLEKELAELKEEVETEKEWPKCGDKYWVFDGEGTLHPAVWEGTYYEVERRWIGNIFRSEEEAWRTKHRLTARKKFLDHGGHEGNDGAYKQYMKIGHFWIASPMTTGTGIFPVIASAQPAIGIWFETEADCSRAIDSLTDDEKAALCWMGESE